MSIDLSKPVRLNKAGTDLCPEEAIRLARELGVASVRLSLPESILYMMPFATPETFEATITVPA